jgi:hypothetical protein
LVQIHIAAPPMVSGKVEHDAHACHCLLCNAGLSEVGLDELYSPPIEVLPNMLYLTAAQVIDDVHAGSTVDQGIYEVRPDERCPSGYEHSAFSPVHTSPPGCFLRCFPLWHLCHFAIHV